MRSTLFTDLSRLRGMLRSPGRVPAHDSTGDGPAPPAPLPPGRMVDLPRRGGMFVRVADDPSGGTALPVVLLHGWTWTADVNFFSLFGPLAADRAVIAPDLRCHGRTTIDAVGEIEDYADDVAALLGALEVPRALVLGYSLGGAVATRLAARHPHLVAGLVLQATALRWGGLRRDAFGLRVSDLAALNLVGLFSTRYLASACASSPALAANWPWLRAELARNPCAATARVGGALRRHDDRSHAAALRAVPSVVVVHTEDRMCRPALQREMAGLLGAEVIESATDHDLPAVDPGRYAELTCAALARLVALDAEDRG